MRMAVGRAPWLLPICHRTLESLFYSVLGKIAMRAISGMVDLLDIAATMIHFTMGMSAHQH